MKVILIYIFSGFYKVITFFRPKNYKNSTVCYYPIFKTKPEYINHIFRAKWYLPYYPPFCERVRLFTNIKIKLNKDDQPAYLRTAPTNCNHIITMNSKLLYYWSLFTSKHIVLWNSKFRKSFLIRCLEQTSKKIHYVDTNDLNNREYAVYCELLWWMLSDVKQKEIIQNSKNNFIKYSEKVKKNKYKKAFVCGNGPSIDDALNIDFNKSFSVVCNSAVKDDELIDHVNPDFIVAGDPLSHFGASTYAEQFSTDLVNVLKRKNICLLIPEFQGFVLFANYPEYQAKIILIPLKKRVPNFNLLQDFRMPLFWGVLNSLMLPIASTFTNNIFILGCDGQNNKKDTEDFWAHSSKVQYHDLMESGHLCHPTFDVHRKAHPEYLRTQLDLASTIVTGEVLHNINYHTLRHSNYVAFKGYALRDNDFEFINIKKLN